MVLGLVVNLEAKGDFFVYPVDDGDFLLRTEDLKAAGFRDPAGRVTIMGGEPHISLKSIPGLAFAYNSGTLALEITAPPALLTKRAIDFAPPRQQDVYYPLETSAFLNYRANYSATSSGFTGFDLTNQLGMRRDELLFLTDTTYSRTPGGGKFVRLMSNITVDRRADLQRTVFGDYFAATGDLGSNVILGGISYARIYKMDPYFITYPSITASGLVATPSEVDIYLDGTKLRTEKIAPGEFELRNLYMTFGTGVVDLVVRDSFGKEQRLSLPYYLTDRLLKKGLQEYSYNIGFVRREFGLESNSYGKPAFSAFHRYGRDDTLTLGMSSEASSDFFSLAPQATWLMGTAGVVTASMAASGGAGNKTGVAGLLGYGFNTRRFSTRLQLKGFSRDYATLENLAGEKKKYEIGAGAGYGTPAFGSLSFDIASAGKYRGENQGLYTVNYARRLTKKMDLFTTLRLIRGATSELRLFCGINYYLGTDRMFSSWVDAGKTSDREVVQLQKNTPVGEGYGYRASVERSGSSAGSVYAVNPAVQYNGRYGVYTADIRGENGAGTSSVAYQLGAAGAVAYAGKTTALTRPINDSFAVVKVGELEGVRVYQNAQEIGKTDARGMIFLDNLNSYLDNQISINDRDIPIDHSLTTVLKHVSSPLRSGSCVIFPALKQQPVTGSLHLGGKGQPIPLEYLEVKISVDGREIAIPTGKGGEFYLDVNQAPSQEAGCAALAAPGAAAAKSLHYSGLVEYRGKRYPFVLNIPKSDEVFIDLGRVVIDAPPLPEQEP